MELNNNSQITQKSKIYGPSYNAVQINMKTPTVNAPRPAMIYDYPQASGQIYYPPIQSKPVSFGGNSTVTRTPSGVGKYENYSEIDENGNEVTSVKFTQNGSAITKTTKVISYDGSTIESVITNDNGNNKMSLIIKDENGNLLLEKNKSVQKINDDKSVTTVNGKTYTVTGLSGDVLSIESDGKITTIDLNKLISKDVCTLLGEEGRTNAWSVGNNNLTKTQSDNIKAQIKNIPADDIINLSKSIDTLYVLESKEEYESFYDANNKRKAILLGPSIENSVTLHELGHAVNNINGNNLLSDNEQLAKAKEQEENNYLKRFNNDEPTDFFCNQKFIDYENLINNANMSKEEAISHLRDEVFAESYSVLNNPIILSENEKFMQMRTLGLMKAFPKTIAEVEKLSEV